MEGFHWQSFLVGWSAAMLFIIVVTKIARWRDD